MNTLCFGAVFARVKLLAAGLVTVCSRQYYKVFSFPHLKNKTQERYLTSVELIMYEL